VGIAPRREEEAQSRVFLCGDPEEALDELHLPFPCHVHHSDSFDGSLGGVKRAEALHSLLTPFHINFLKKRFAAQTSRPALSMNSVVSPAESTAR
jgi:hypothetical protein